MSTSLFFSKLKTFCYEAEQDAKKLRKQVDVKTEGINMGQPARAQHNLPVFGLFSLLYEPTMLLQVPCCQLMC
jgi:hypothetical protein